jgi:PE family
VSFVNVAPEMVASAAGDLDGIRSLLSAANAAAAPSTTGIAPPAMDQVSAAIAAVLGTHALEYQTVSAQVADLHAQFVGALNSGASQYLSTEAGNAEQSLLNAVNSPAQALLGHPLTGTGAETATGTAGALGGTGSPVLAVGGVPATGTGETESVGALVLNTNTPFGSVKLLTGTVGLATGAVSLTSGSLVVPLGGSLGVDAVSPYLTTATALQNSSATFTNALSSGRPVAAVNALAHTPGNAVRSFLSDQGTTSDSTAAPSGVNIPVEGLLGPALHDDV